MEVQDAIARVYARDDLDARMKTLLTRTDDELEWARSVIDEVERILALRTSEDWPAEVEHHQRSVRAAARRLRACLAGMSFAEHVHAIFDHPVMSVDKGTLTIELRTRAGLSYREVAVLLLNARHDGTFVWMPRVGERQRNSAKAIKLMVDELKKAVRRCLRWEDDGEKARPTVYDTLLNAKRKKMAAKRKKRRR